MAILSGEAVKEKEQAISLAQLMEASWRRLSAVARAGSGFQQQVVTRVLEDPARWRKWEAEHNGLMSGIAAHREVTPQLTAMRSTALGLIHRKALFEFLRANQGLTQQRRQLMALFHARRRASEALLLEHTTYLECACSHLCSTHVGAHLMTDGTFQEPIEYYEAQYTEYFQSFCRCALAGPGDQSLAAEQALLPYRRYDLNRQRQAILYSPRLTPDMLRDAKLRQPTGDTVRIHNRPLRLLLKKP
jgi:hypothetical protein